MTLASSYTMLFVGPEDVCFVKKKKKWYFYLLTFYAVVSVQMLYCSVHVVTLALWLVVTPTEPVLVMLKKQQKRKTYIKKKSCLHVPKCLYFLRKSAFPLNDSTWNKSNHFTFEIGIYWLLFAVWKEQEGAIQ